MRNLRRKLLSPYHFLWALGSAIYYRFPAKKLTVIGVTGTKGKSSVTEMVAGMLEEAGYTVAISSTIHFKIGQNVRPNLFKMTLPGRGFLQKFLRNAVDAGCTHAVVELTSESALQYRHRFTSLNALIFTNLEPEHIESHGSMEKYFQAKFEIGKELARSSKRPRAIVANNESEYGERFLTLPVESPIPYAYGDVEDVVLENDRASFSYEDVSFTLPHPGRFSVMNALATIKTGVFLGVPLETISKGLEKLTKIAGRAERIEAGQSFAAVVDYAHTPESIKALYEAYTDVRKICVLGNTGGGRDTWKRPLMGQIADELCDEVILTNEDPYDEDPMAILNAMAEGTKREPRIILDRREAIHTALSLAKDNDAVLITGKGTDPYIMEASGKKTPWSDAQVVKEELEKLLAKQ